MSQPSVVLTARVGRDVDQADFTLPHGCLCLAQLSGELHPMVADGRMRIAEGELPLTEAGLPFHPDAAVFLPRPLRMKRAERLIFSRVL